MSGTRGRVRGSVRRSGNERPDLYLSSALITAAVAAARWYWPGVPALGMVTFAGPRKVRRKRDPGRCFRRAGFQPAGTTKGGLIALQLLPTAMPEPAPPAGAQLALTFTTDHDRDKEDPS